MTTKPLALTDHSLIVTLKNLRGNVRGCVYTEPLWGIPYNLYAPYASVYMLAFGLADSQIGLIASIGLFCQIFWAMMGGPITDKLGRKRTTLVFDLIGWSVPCLIWAVAQNFTYFLVAAIINSVWRITSNSWQCLMVEDTDPRLLVDVYSWVYIAGLMAAFVSPFTGLLIEQFSLIPTMRGLYLLAFVMMTAKFVIMNALVTETQQGQARMQATRGRPVFAVLREYPAVIKQIWRAPATLFTAGLMIILGIGMLINNTFWAILVTEKLQIAPQYLALYPFAKSVTMLMFFFLIMPRLRGLDVHRPMIVGFTGLALSQLLLINIPVQHYWLLLVATVLEGCSIPLASTLLDKLLIVTVDPSERARIMALLYVTVIVFTTPFGWIAGQMSEANRNLPFALNIVLLSLAGLLAYLAGRLAKRQVEQPTPLEFDIPAGQDYK
ncbi:MAG: MFS transporter [Anaerolineae bacterium]|nr:MFS transporter [Anaerolineae bacterium]